MFLAKMYGPELVRHSASSSASGIPDNRMNPGKVVEPRRPDQDSATRPDTAAQPAQRIRLSRTTAARSPAPRRAASASAHAAAIGGGTMCPSYMVTREEEAFHPRPRAPAVRNDARRRAHRWLAQRSTSRTRSTSAWPARDARPSAPSTSTWRHTRPSSCRTTTRPGAAARGVRDGLIYWWARLATRRAGRQLLHADAAVLHASLKALGGIAPAAHDSALRAAHIAAWFTPTQPHATAGASASSSGPTRSATISTPAAIARRSKY